MITRKYFPDISEMTCRNIWKRNISSCLLMVKTLFIWFLCLYSWFLDSVALTNNIYLSIFALNLSCILTMRDVQSSAADLGFCFRGCAEWNLAFGKYSEPPTGLGHSARSQRIQSYLQLKTSLKWQCQRQLASARFD